MLGWIDMVQRTHGPLKIMLEWEGLPFQFQTLFNYYFNIFRFKFTLDTINNALMTLFFFHIVSARWNFGPSAMSVIVEFSLNWTTDY